MSRRSLPAILAAVAASGLLLAACGSDNETARGASADDSGNDGPRTARPSLEAGSGRPQIALPKDLKLTFTPEKTGDRVQDAVLRDNAERMKAVNAAIAGLDPGDEALRYYNSGDALAEASEWVGRFEKEELTVTGSVHFFDRHVTLKDDGTAHLVFCADESKGYSKSRRTGEVNRTPITRDSYVGYQTELERNARGVWQTTHIVSERGAARCQP